MTALALGIIALLLLTAFVVLDAWRPGVDDRPLSEWETYQLRDYVEFLDTELLFAPEADRAEIGALLQEAHDELATR